MKIDIGALRKRAAALGCSFEKGPTKFAGYMLLKEGKPVNPDYTMALEDVEQCLNEIADDLDIDTEAGAEIKAVARINAKQMGSALQGHPHADAIRKVLQGQKSKSADTCDAVFEEKRRREAEALRRSIVLFRDAAEDEDDRFEFIDPFGVVDRKYREDDAGNPCGLMASVSELLPAASEELAGAAFFAGSPRERPLVAEVKRRLSPREIARRAAERKGAQLAAERRKRLDQITAEVTAALAAGRKPNVGPLIAEAKLLLEPFGGFHAWLAEQGISPTSARRWMAA